MTRRSAGTASSTDECQSHIEMPILDEMARLGGKHLCKAFPALVRSSITRRQRLGSERFKQTLIIHPEEQILLEMQQRTTHAAGGRAQNGSAYRDCRTVLIVEHAAKARDTQKTIKKVTVHIRLQCQVVHTDPAVSRSAPRPEVCSIQQDLLL